MELGWLCSSLSVVRVKMPGLFVQSPFCFGRLQFSSFLMHQQLKFLRIIASWAVHVIQLTNNISFLERSRGGLQERWWRGWYGLGHSSGRSRCIHSDKKDRAPQCDTSSGTRRSPFKDLTGYSSGPSQKALFIRYRYLIIDTCLFLISTLWWMVH